MKYLYFVRHAKSSWDNTSLTDFERPLNSRGRTDAPKMGLLLKSKKILPNLVLSSPANRAITTARMVCQAINYPLTKIEIRNELYDTSFQKVLNTIELVNSTIDVLMIFGHNEWITEMVNYLSPTPIENIATCGVVALKCHINDWFELDYSTIDLLFYEKPLKSE